jgi:hypothetical protein
MLDAGGNGLNIEFQDAGLLPNIGDHIVFFRAGSEYDENKKLVSKTEQIEGVVENRLFFFFTQGHVGVNIVVTDSKTDSGKLIKE